MAIKYYKNLINGLPKETKFKSDRIDWEKFPSEADKSHFKKGNLTLRDYINSSVGSGQVPQYDFAAGEKSTDDKTFMYMRDKSLTMAEKYAINKNVQSKLSKEVKESLDDVSEDLILQQIEKGSDNPNSSQT